MKKALALVLTLIVCVSLTACFKSEEAKAVESLIDVIGAVTLDSTDAIVAAETAYESLTPEQKEEVANYDQLTAARLTLVELEAKKAAAEIDAIINEIGTVTLESGEKITAGRTAYDAAPADVQGFVANIDILTAAETELARLQDELCQQQAAKVIELINAIGTVSIDNGSAIEAAQAAYDSLSDAAKAYVSNASTLTAAHQEYKALLKAEAEQLLKGMTVEKDAVRGLSFYYPSAFPYYSSYGYWAADIRSFVLPYLGMQNNSVWLRLICHYTDDDWIFFDKITFAVDDQRFYKYFSYYDVTRDNEYGDVWEYVDIEVGDSEIELLEAIANSSNTIIRFEGDDYYEDITVSDKDKKAIKQMLTVYKGLS